jgi:hypothetical protein
MIKNYQLIPVENNSSKNSNITYQTSFFKYINLYTFNEEIGKLHKSLKKINCIDCSVPTFRSIFSDNNTFEKVNWLKSQSSFQLFIQLLVSKEKVICRQLWVKAAACFVIKGEVKTSKQLGKVENPSSDDAVLIRECIKYFK